MHQVSPPSHLAVSISAVDGEPYVWVVDSLNWFPCCWISACATEPDLPGRFSATAATTLAVYDWLLERLLTFDAGAKDSKTSTTVSRTTKRT